MPDPDRGGRPPRHLLAIALASFAVLFFQIAVTRVLSVVLWYHWVFLSITLAMLGLGAPGVWFALRPPAPSLLPRLLLVGGLSLPAATAAVLWIGNRFGAYSVLAIMGCVLLPMLALGAAVCQLLLAARDRALGRMYGADLLGAAAAALVVVPAMAVLPTPDALALLGLVPVAAAWLCGARPATAGAAAIAIVALAAWGDPFVVRHTKSADEHRLRLVHERWTPTARLAFFDLGVTLGLEPEEHEPGFAWGYGSKAPRQHLPQYWMEQDASAGTPITMFDGNVDDMGKYEYLLYDVTTFGYQLRPPQRVAVVGAGGGRDVLSALLAGARDVDAIELNPGVVETLSTRFREFSGDIYHARGVNAVVSEGRSHLTRSRGGYDLLQISLIDSWAATAAGAFSLAENNLYTVEAYRLWLEKLSPGGIVSTSRWRSGVAQSESIRLLFLQQRALRDLGIAEPEAHMVAVAGGQVMTLLASRTAFSPAEIEAVRAICDRRGFELLHPGGTTPDALGVARLLRDGPGLFAAGGLQLEPPTDDRPFFFQMLPVFGRFDFELAKAHGANSEAVAGLQLLMAIVAALNLLLFFLPFALARWLPRRPGFWRGSGYFAAIGVSFLLIEIPWLQRFVLYLGHPSIAATVVLGALLLGAGAGSLVSARWSLAAAYRCWPLVPIAAALVNAGMGPLFEATLGAAEALRIVVAVALVLPIGFLLGHCFPLGMRRFGDDDKAWFWAINGACGVLASVLSLALAMQFGFRAVAWIGVLGYVVAGLLLRPQRGAA